MKKILLIALLVAGSVQTFAQQDPQYSLYMFNPIGVNPGYTGSREVLSAVLVHRSQWVGLKGAPETQVFSINTPFKNKKMGIGLQFTNDKIGAHATQTLKLMYAYRLKLGAGKLAFGLGGGILNYSYDWDKIDYKESEDAIPTNSPESFIIPTFDFGIYYNTKTMYLGFAAEHLNQASFGLAETSSTSSAASNGGFGSGTSSGSGSAKKDMNITGTFGKAFVLNDKLVLKSALLVRLANSAASMDVSGGLLISNKIFFGLSLRNAGTSTIVVMTEINLTKNLRMGAGYDLGGGELTKSTSGSFEIFVGYDVGLFKSKVVSPRYF